MRTRNYLIAFFILLLASSASAYSDTKGMTATLRVNTIFSLAVDQSTIDFMNMSQGESKENQPANGLLVTAKSNSPYQWYLKISAQRPLYCGPDEIPLENFFWHGWSDGRGTWYGNRPEPLPLSPVLTYVSSPNEGPNLPSGTINHFQFDLKIPKGQPAGKYSTTVLFTMTE